MLKYRIFIAFTVAIAPLSIVLADDCAISCRLSQGRLSESLASHPYLFDLRPRTAFERTHPVGAINAQPFELRHKPYLKEAATLLIVSEGSVGYGERICATLRGSGVKNVALTTFEDLVAIDQPFTGITPPSHEIDATEVVQDIPEREWLFVSDTPLASLRTTIIPADSNFNRSLLALREKNPESPIGIISSNITQTELPPRVWKVTGQWEILKNIKREATKNSCR